MALSSSEIDAKVADYFRALEHGGLANVWQPEVWARIMEQITPEQLKLVRKFGERSIARSEQYGLWK